MCSMYSTQADAASPDTRAAADICSSSLPARRSLRVSCQPVPSPTVADHRSRRSNPSSIRGTSGSAKIILVLAVTIPRDLERRFVGFRPRRGEKEFVQSTRQHFHQFACLNSARMVVAQPGPNISQVACLILNRLNHRLVSLWPSVTHISCAEKSRYFFPSASVK